MIKEVENIIASKLLGAYYSDWKYMNRQGPNLFSDETPEKERGFGISLANGPKISLICTWVDDYPNEPLGELDEIEKLAIKTLIEKRNENTKTKKVL